MSGERAKLHTLHTASDPKQDGKAKSSQRKALLGLGISRVDQAKALYQLRSSHHASLRPRYGELEVGAHARLTLHHLFTPTHRPAVFRSLCIYLGLLSHLISLLAATPFPPVHDLQITPSALIHSLKPPTKQMSLAIDLDTSCRDRGRRCEKLYLTAIIQ